MGPAGKISLAGRSLGQEKPRTSGNILRRLRHQADHLWCFLADHTTGGPEPKPVSHSERANQFRHSSDKLVFRSGQQWCGPDHPLPLLNLSCQPRPAPRHCDCAAALASPDLEAPASLPEGGRASLAAAAAEAPAGAPPTAAEAGTVAEEPEGPGEAAAPPEVEYEFESTGHGPPSPSNSAGLDQRLNHTQTHTDPVCGAPDPLVLLCFKTCAFWISCVSFLNFLCGTQQCKNQHRLVGSPPTRLDHLPIFCPMSNPAHHSPPPPGLAGGLWHRL